MLPSTPIKRKAMEVEPAFAARVLQRAAEHGVDVADLAARIWEVPGEATLAEIQVLGAAAFTYGPDE